MFKYSIYVFKYSIYVAPRLIITNDFTITKYIFVITVHTNSNSHQA